MISFRFRRTALTVSLNTLTVGVLAWAVYCVCLPWWQQYRALEALREALERKDSTYRELEEATDRVIDLHAEEKAAWMILPMISDPSLDPSRHSVRCDTIGILQSNNDRLTSELLSRFRNPTLPRDHRRNIGRALRRSGPTAVRGFMEALEDEDLEVRADAARALGRCIPPAVDAIDALSKLAARESEDGEEAQFALRQIEKYQRMFSEDVLSPPK